jgi:hypothetical protein
MEGTRQELLAQLTAWFNDTDPSSTRIFWLSGLAGTGKTTVARTMADWAQTHGRLAATFFFSRNTEATRIPAAIIPTLAYQLAQYQLPFKSLICKAVASDEDVRDRSIRVQAKTLLGDLSQARTTVAPLLIVLDALDECRFENGCEGGHAIPSLFASMEFMPSVKILLTSRVEDTIERMLAKSFSHNIALHNIDAGIVQGDIHHYLTHSFEELARERSLTPQFPPDGVVDTLVRRAGSLFIYAATVIKWVSDPRARPELRLRQILEHHATEIPFQYKLLDGMYMQILSQAAETSGSPEVHERALKNVLSAVVLLQEPVDASTLAALASNEEQNGVVIPLLAAVLVVSADEPVRLFHASFPDFVTDPKRCQDERFLVTRPEGHLRLAVRCLDIMNSLLCQDICGIKDPSLFNNEVSGLEQLLVRAAPSELRYACKYWHIHLRHVDPVSSDLIHSLDEFCRTHLLHWIELLSLLNEVPSALAGMRPLLAYLLVRIL